MSVALIFSAQAPIHPSAKHEPSWGTAPFDYRDDTVTIGNFPVRPKDVRAVHIAIGRVVRYVATQSPAGEHLTIEEAGHRKLTFELALTTRIDGKIFSCEEGWHHDPVICPPLPKSIRIGKTTIAVLYWDTDPTLVGSSLPDVPGSGYHGTDEILTIER